MEKDKSRRERRSLARANKRKAGRNYIKALVKKENRRRDWKKLKAKRKAAKQQRRRQR